MVISAKRELQLEQHPVDGSMVSQKKKNKNKTKTKTNKTQNFIQVSSRSSAGALIGDAIAEIKN